MNNRSVLQHTQYDRSCFQADSKIDTARLKTDVIFRYSLNRRIGYGPARIEALRRQRVIYGDLARRTTPTMAIVVPDPSSRPAR